MADVVRASAGVCTPHFLFRPEVATANRRLVDVACSLTGATVLPTDDVATIEAPPVPAQGLLTFADEELERAQALLDRWNLPGASTGPVWDKLVQRQRLSNAGLSSLSCHPVDGAADIRAAVDSAGIPLVLKPRRGAGGARIRYVDSPQVVEALVRGAHDLSDMVAETVARDGSHPAGDPLLADFVSVELASSAERRTCMAVFDKVPVSIVRARDVGAADRVRVSGDRFPSLLPPDDRRRCIELVARAHDVLDVRSRLTHTEVKLTPDGPEIIEINGRLGGDLARLTRLTEGPDLVRAALLAALDEDVTALAEEYAPAATAAAGFYPTFVDPSGTVTSEVAVSTIRQIPGVVGVEHVALAGMTRVDRGERAVDITVRSPDAGHLGGTLRNAALIVRDLFTSDPIGPACWFGLLDDGPA